MNNRNRDKEYLNIKEKLCNIEENISKVKLQCFNYKSYTLDFIQKIDEEIKSNSKSIEELKSPFLLFIIGPGKYGKTTLINSLIQDKLLEINDIPNTWKLDVLQKSNKKRIEIYYSDGSCKEVLYNDGIKIVQEEEQKYKSSKKLIKKQFDDYKIHNKKNIQELKQYKQELENKNLYISNIEEVKFYINKSKILEDFIIVDTPGLNQTLKKNTKNRMLNYYKRADGVIWIIDAQNVVSTCSNDLLKELKINYMLEENFNNVICVVNKIDCIKKEDREKIFYKVNELYKSNFKDVVLVSSKQALNGYLSKDITLINSSNICSLIKSIDKNFKNHSEEIQIKSKYNNLKITSIKINNYIDIYKRHLYSDIHKYEESKRTVEEELEKLKNELEIKVNKYISINNLEDKNIEEELRILEKNINEEVNKFKSSMMNISIINNEYKSEYTEKEINNLNITKSKHVININKYIRTIEIEKLQKNNIINFYKQVIEKDNVNEKDWILRFKIDKFKKAIIKNIESKLLEVKLNIDDIRDRSFRNQYTDYDIIPDHLKLINNISNNINMWR